MATKEITILKRAVCKKASTSYGVQAGDLICLVKGDTGNVYVTTLRNNGHHTCTCKSTRKCYHIKGCEKANNARIEAVKVATPEVVETPEQKEEREWALYRTELAKKLSKQFVTTQCVEQIAESLVVMPAQEQVPPIAMELPAELRGYRKTAVSSDLSTKGSINGAQQSAGLLMALPSRKARAS